MSSIRQRFLFSGFALLLALFAVLNISAQSGYQAEIKNWREQHESELKADGGWLTLTGLFWLKEGENTVGSASNNAVILPTSTAPQVGKIEFNGNTAKLVLNDGISALADGKSFREISLTPDADGKPTVIQLGDVSFTLIKREDRYGIRVRDKNSPNRAKFTNLHWFPVDESYRVTARFEPYSAPKEIEIPNVLGGTFKMKSPGLLRFTLGGKDYSLESVEEGEQYFIIFNDLTSRTITYQPGRFLYSPKAAAGKVILDFNQAYNPPCAFTEYATCPLPPPQNRLKAEIKAGEMRYDH